MQESNNVGKISLVIAYKEYIVLGQVFQMLHTLYRQAVYHIQSGGKLPAIVGIKIQDGVFNEASNNGGHLFIPDPSNVDIAHAPTHAVLVVGYDDRNQQFIVRNSWGSHWVTCESVFCMRISSSFFFQGDQGYFYMPYDYLLDERLVNYSDGAWIITGIERKAKHHHPHRH